MSDLSFKKFTRQLNERRYIGPQGTVEYKKLSPKMRAAINDVYSMINKVSDPIVSGQYQENTVLVLMILTIILTTN